MATAAEGLEESDQSTSAAAVSEIGEKREIFQIRLHYLKSKLSVMNCFVGSLPKHIKTRGKEKYWKDIETSYSNYDVTFDQKFETTRPLSIEEDVCYAWFSNKPPSEDVAWIEIIRKKRVYPTSAKYGKEFSFSDVRVVGGSMISPVTFVRHWELSNYRHNLKVSFQEEPLMWKIEKTVDLGEIFDNVNLVTFTLEATCDSLHDTIIVHKTNTCLIMLLNLKFSPKIYGNTRKFYWTTRAIANQTNFNDLGCLNTFYFEFDLSRHTFSEIKILLSRLICLGFHVVYANVQTTIPESERIDLPTYSFEVAYAWECVQSLGYKVTDQLSAGIKDCIKQLSRGNKTLTSQIFYNLAVQIMEKPFFFLKQELNLAKQRTAYKDDTKRDLPPRYCMVARVMLTPTRLLFLPEEPVFQNRILRQYGEEFFIRVVFRDEDFERVSTVQSSALNNILDRMKTFFKDGFEIHDRHYEFLGCSNSQLREHSFWFFYPHDDITVDRIRNNSGELSSEMCVASYVSRFGLCFSATQKTVDVDKKCVRYKEDVKNGEYCFTDGIGCISPHLAKKVAKELQIYPVPSAFQIRFGGCKGVVAQEPTLGNEQDVLVIRDSMRKFESQFHNLEILDVTKPGRLHLNKQVILLLSGLGIPDQVFMNLQEKMLIDMADMLLDDEKALSALLESAIDMDFRFLAERGISFIQEPFFRSLLRSIYHHKLSNLMQRTKIQIPLDKGRIMMGTSDESKTLRPGQVFIKYSKETHAPGQNVILHEGLVVVTKNPCFHEGDIRVFQAVNVPSLSHMVDCIVFPQVGSRPHPDEMSGSDLDGDMYFVCWDEELCKFKNKEPMDFPKAEKKRENREISSHDIIDFLADYIRYDKLGLIANAHLVQADSNKNGVFSEECHKLAKMHSYAVDFPKTGNIPKLDDELRPKVYPDFMMKRDKQMYCSTKIMGKLFRQCRSILWMQKQYNFFLDIDEDFLSNKIDDNTIKEAKHQKISYDRKVLEVLNLYGIKTEAEAITGLVQSVKAVKGCLKDEKFQVGKILKETITKIQKETREVFFQEFRGETNVRKGDGRVLRKALAWYIVTYDCKLDHMQDLDPIRPILSFPWIVADILVEVKSSRKDQPSRLDKFLEDYYKVSQSHKEREFKLITSNKIIKKVKSLLREDQRERVEFISVGLEGCGISKRLKHFNIGVRGLQIDEITEKMKEENVRIITDDNMIHISTTMQDYLRTSSVLIPTVQFLQDLLQDVLPEDSLSHRFSDLIAAVIVYFCLSESNITISVPQYFNRNAVCLISVLKTFILGPKSLKLRVCHELPAFHLTSDVMSKIADHLLVVFQKIAQHVDNKSNPFLQFVNKVNDYSNFEEFEDSEQYGVFDLPTSVVDSIICAEEFIEVQLSLRSHADVLFYNCQKGPMKIAAWGTEKALENITEIIDKILKTPRSKLSSDASNGHIIADGAYSITFEGGCDESEVIFEKCHGNPHEPHDKKEMFIPKLKHVIAKENTLCKDFEEKFIQQWNILKSEYNELLHGKLCMNISFGMFFVRNIQPREHINVLKLNNLIRTLDQRKKQQQMGRTRNRINQPLPYIFTFQPEVNLRIDRIRSILENLGFSSLDRKIEKRISVRINGRLRNFDENGKLCSINFSDIKWGMVTVVPEARENQTLVTNIRFRLQSFREVDRKDFHIKEEFLSLLELQNMLLTPNGYSLDVSSHKNDISYAREKVIETYQNMDSDGDDLSASLKVEVARVTELKPNTESKTTELQRGTSRVEVILSPGLPPLESSNEEIKSYARYILDKALRFAGEF